LFVQSCDGLPWYVVIADDFRMDDGKPRRYEWLLVTAAGNAIRLDGGGRFAILGRDHALRGVVLAPADAQLTVDSVPHTYYWGPGGEGSAAGEMTHWGDYPRLRVSQSGKDGRFLVLLMPGDVADVEGFGSATQFGARLHWRGASDEVVLRPAGAGPRWRYCRTRGSQTRPKVPRSASTGRACNGAGLSTSP
jgi:hypothetical protein